jgi:hypothetical protein
MRDKFRKRKWLFIPIFIAAVFLFGAIVMGLWNAILPAVLGVKIINLWQALGILLLSKILFGGFHGGWRGGPGKGRWLEMQQKLAAMTPEEREKFKAAWKDRCSGNWKMRNQDSTVAEAE